MAVESDHYAFYYNCCPEPYPLIYFTLVLRREVIQNTSFFPAFVFCLCLIFVALFASSS